MRLSYDLADGVYVDETGTRWLPLNWPLPRSYTSTGRTVESEDRAYQEVVKSESSPPNNSKFKVGDKVVTVHVQSDLCDVLVSYRFPGVVVSVYTTLKGKTRYVVECTSPDVEECQHIFNEDQLQYA